MNHTRRLSLVVASTFFAVTLAAISCSSSTQMMTQTKVIPVTAIIDQTGSAASPSYAQTVRLVEKQMNEAMGQVDSLKKYKFEVTIVDSRNDPANTVAEALKAVDAGTKGLILDNTANVIAVNRLQYDADMSNNLNVPLSCASCTGSTVNNPTATAADPIDQAASRNEGKWLWKATASTRLISKVHIQILLARGENGDVNGDGRFKIAVLQADDPLGRSVTADITTALRDLRPDGGTVEVILHKRDAPDSFDWNGDWLQATDDSQKLSDGGIIVNGAADVAAIGSFPLLVANATSTWVTNQNTYKLPLFHTTIFRTRAVADALGSKAEGQEGVSFLPYESTVSGQQFKADFQTEYSTEPALRDPFFYDATASLMLALARQQLETAENESLDPVKALAQFPKIADTTLDPTPSGVVGFRTALTAAAESKNFNYDGVTGPMDYDANGNVRNRIARFKVENGVFKNVQVYDCVKDDTCPPVQ